MKRKFMTLAVLAVTAFSMTIMAQEPQNTTPGACNSEQCAKQGHHNRKQHGDRQMKMDKDCLPVDSAMAFKGITLTAQQSEAIAKINAETRAAAKAVREKVMAEKKANKEKGSADKAQKDCRKDGKKQCDANANCGSNPRTQARLDYMHKIQKVLTADQYITFLENTATSAQSAKPGKPGCKHGHRR